MSEQTECVSAGNKQLICELELGCDTLLIDVKKQCFSNSSCPVQVCVNNVVPFDCIACVHKHALPLCWDCLLYCQSLHDKVLCLSKKGRKLGEKFFCEKIKSCRERPVKSTEARWDESTLGYPVTEHGEKERQGRLHYIYCTAHFCNGCSVLLSFFFAMLSNRVTEGAFIPILFSYFLHEFNF